MVEKSGIQMIESLLEKVNLLDRRFVVVEQMVKELLNRANGFEKPKEVSLEKPMIGATAKQPKMEPSQLVSQQSKPQIGDTPVTSGPASKTIKVLGRIHNSDGKMLSGVFVKVFDTNNNVVKETKTNRAGDWLCFLPPGKYGAEYLLKGVIHANVNFNVIVGQKMVRVAQPKYRRT